MEAQTTEIVSVSNIQAMPVGSSICSIKANGDRAAAAKIFNAMNNPTGKIADKINMSIEVENFMIEIVEVTSEETGEISEVPRVVFITPDGESYVATSFGMATVLRNMVATCGNAPWKPAIKLAIRQRATKRGSMLTADMEL